MLRKIAVCLTAILVILASLIPAMPTVLAAGTNLIDNPSVELNTNNYPNGWLGTKTGTNTTSFNYLSSGRTGNHSLQIQMTRRTSGQAEWKFNPVTINPSTTYNYSDWYQSSVPSKIAVLVTNRSGRTTTLTTVNMGASSAWQQSNLSFKTPSNAASVTVHHYINSVGQITLDDFDLEAPTPVAPSISISAPINNTTVSDVQAISATTANAVGVQFKIDGTNFGLEDTSQPFSISWDTKSVVNGSHTISATARSVNSLTSTASISVTVSNVTAPSISFSSPTNGSTVSGTSQIISVNVGDTLGIAGVQYKLDNTNLGNEVTTAPYSLTWDTTNTTNGSHTLTSTARNTSGLTTTSSLAVNVQNIITPPVTPNNLIPNPSGENSSSNLPTSWSSGSWGTNSPVYTYMSTGHTGSRSLKTQINSYTSGDAKWFFNPVSVNGGSVYSYSHYYMSSVSTDVVAQYTDANGNNTYKWLATLGSSQTWQQFSSDLSVPAGTTKLTVLHIIYSVGWVQIDDASLVLNSPMPQGIIPNSSLELASGALPMSWQKNSWGSNTSNFEYVNEGHTGSHSAKVTVSNYVNGDAKWYFDPLTTLQRGSQYSFNTWYKTNSTPHAVVLLVKDDGTESYLSMPNPTPNGTSDWQYYSSTFQVPTDVKAVSVFFLMSSNGWLQIDDQAIVPYQPTGFSRPLLTLTFDDGPQENVINALPILNSFGFKTTHCFISSLIENDPAQVQSNVMAFFSSGHEICSHTVTHPFLAQLNTTNLDYELQHSKQYLESITGQPVTDFVSPYGDYNEAVVTAIKQYYQSHRTVDEGYNSKENFDVYHLRVQNVLNTTTASQVRSWITQAQTDKTWLILVYHRVAPDAGPYDTLPSTFTQQLQEIQNSGIVVKTMQDTIIELKAQL